MPSAKQIKARKLFAMRSKRGDFKKSKKSEKAQRFSISSSERKKSTKAKSTSVKSRSSTKIDPVTGKKILYQKIGKWKKEGKNYVRHSITRIQH